MIIGTPHRHNAGYYFNDDRVGGGKLTEGDVQTCTHCQAVIIMQEWKKKGAWCKRCVAPICHACGTRMKTYGCEPFLAKLEKEVDAAIKYKRYLLEAGMVPLPPPQPIIIDL